MSSSKSVPSSSKDLDYVVTKALVEALSEVNRLRALHHLAELSELPCGERGSPTSCPISHGLRQGSAMHVTAGRRSLWIGRERVNTPRAIERFISLFDKGLFPALVAPVTAGT